MTFLVAFLAASIVWFMVAGILFFNPFVDKIYRSQEGHPAVRAMPRTLKTTGMIILAIAIQVFLWAWVYLVVKSSLPGGAIEKGLIFGAILGSTKIIPRDTDRLLLTTYPKKRMFIEFVIGIICGLCIGVVFGYLL